jgi:predicted permease
MHTLLGNLRYTLRQFRQSPVFASAAVLTLALGIGGTTAIFTLIHAVMLRSLPVSDPARLYRIGEGDDCCVEGGPQDRWGFYPYSFYQQMLTGMPEFEEVTAFQAGQGRMAVRRERVDTAARPLRSEYVDGHYFSTLGVQSLGGRLITPADDSRSAPPVAVLSHHVWQTVYGADPAVVGASFIIEGHPFTIVGVAPPGFFGETLRSDPPEIWLPLQQDALMTDNKGLLNSPFSAWLRVIGRVRPGATTAAMGPRLTGMLRQWMLNDSQYPVDWMPEIKRHLPNQIINIVPAGAGVAVMKEDYGRSLQILFAVCAVVLLIACANVANLLLARAVARRAQTAVRLAIGATRRQIIGQALTESILLAVLGGLLGLAVSVGAARLLLSLAFHSAHFLPISVAPSPIVLGFACLVALLTGIIFGAAPAWFATRTDPADALRGSARSTGDHSSFARKALLILQATLSVVLVAGATMLARSLNKLEHQDFGYPVPGRVLVSMNSAPPTYTAEKLTSLYREMQQRLLSIPGVRGGGLAMYNPLTDNWGEFIMVEGHEAPKFNENADSSWDRVSANYLQSLGVKLLRGRMFTEADNETSENVAVVNEAFMKRFFKSGEEPLDHHFGLDLPQNASTYRIVGIIHDARFAGFELNKPPRPMFYVAMTQYEHYPDALMARLETGSHNMRAAMLVTDADPGALEPQLTRILADLDPNLTLISVRRLQEQVDRSFEQERAVAGLAGLFGIVALVLAAIGLYGVTAYTVAQRTNEIGVRMALGADRRNVVELVLRGAFSRVGLGLLLGVPLAIGAGRLISTQLYGVSFWDPMALGVAAGSLAACAFLAAIIPAGRAASISPMSALRTE